MATRAATITSLGLEAVRVVWTGITAGDDGEPVDLHAFPERSIEIAGTAGTTVLTWQGCNQATPAAWYTLNDLTALPLSFDSVLGCEGVAEFTAWQRPKSTGGAGATISVILIARKPR
jgi:hypothetical protein